MACLLFLLMLYMQAMYHPTQPFDPERVLDHRAAAEWRTAHNDGWKGREWNGIKHMETMCLMYLISFH